VPKLFDAIGKLSHKKSKRVPCFQKTFTPTHRPAPQSLANDNHLQPPQLCVRTLQYSDTSTLRSLTLLRLHTIREKRRKPKNGPSRCASLRPHGDGLLPNGRAGTHSRVSDWLHGLAVVNRCLRPHALLRLHSLPGRVRLLTRPPTPAVVVR
jgi:hypothetical protein